MSWTERPMTWGRRYSSMAVATASGRWVKVAHPSPKRSGSSVSTFTTTSRVPSGAVRITRTSRMRGLLRSSLCHGGGSNRAGEFGISVVSGMLCFPSPSC